MPKIKLVISDLHLAESHSIFEGFGDLQQSALEGLLSAASTNGFTDNPDDVELIINGDCFEFLFMEPHEKQGITYPATALSKLERVIDGHRPFFNALQHFISQTGRHVTFIIGNHDMELLRSNVFGNPHSLNPTSRAMTELCDQARASVLKFFNASSDEYTVIFTSNASNALKLVGEAYPSGKGNNFCYSSTNTANLGMQSGGAVRVSLGLVTNFADVYHFMQFAETLLNNIPTESDLQPRVHC